VAKRFAVAEETMNLRLSNRHHIRENKEGSGVAVPLLRKKVPEMTKIPVLCRFRQEDGVWNGTAEDLAVAVFGPTFEETQKNLSDAILCHLEALQELKQIEPTIDYLQRRARECNVTLEDMPNNRPVMRMNATLFDNQVAMTV
jgi:predicted RNase H-like HicB family nuclease